MSINIKLMSFLFLVLLPFQKQKDKCLIIRLSDDKESFKITNIGKPKVLYYIILEYPKSKEKDDINENPLVTVPYIKNRKSTSYNLQNKFELKSLPDSINQCNCASLKDFNLGMKFKLYVEKEDGWVVYDAITYIVEE